MRTNARAQLSSSEDEAADNSGAICPSSPLSTIAINLATVISRCHFTLYRIETDQEGQPFSQSHFPRPASVSSSFSPSPSTSSRPNRPRTQVQVIRQHLSFLADLKTNLNAEQVEAVRQVIHISRGAAEAVATEHLESHIYFSRLGRSIDRCLSTKSSEAVTQSQTFATFDNQVLHEVAILHYLIRSGHDEIAIALVEEAKLDNDVIYNKLLELRQILRSLKFYDPNPAFEWVHKQEDAAEHSELLFRLHKVVFRQMALSAGGEAAVDYAQEHFPPYADSHRTEITEVMASLVSDDRTLPPNYIWTKKDMDLWRSVKEALLQGICKSLKLQPKCHLRNIIDIGCKVLPRVLEIQEIMTESNMPTPWYMHGELPVECVNFFHSTLICPILREECSEENPPVRLSCGHVISKIAMERLANIRSSRIKCPYCPAYSEMDSIKRIYI
ncbi:E3 ubiquitin-protein transferase RMND5B-like [Arctopsyche grandis]|uniref:E3 ubiquitin-protein transferase RMND5B-like n=1 Tax=Arctopsyche grandis TaxID=121162 RepID=UPI00406D865F